MSQKPDIAGVAHLGIRVTDLETTRAFYEQLGFQFVVGPVGPEPVAIMKHPGGLEINFILNAKRPAGGQDPQNILMDVPEKHAGYTHVAMRVPDLDAWVAELEKREIPLSGGPSKYPGGARSLFLRDPDRNVIELYQYPPA